MNDEEFGQTLLRQAFPTEPVMNLDVDVLVRDGRRDSRNRRIARAAGGTALVCVVGLAAFGLRVADGQTGGPATSTATSSSISQASPSPCPSVELGGFVDEALPGRPLGSVKTEVTTCTVTDGQVSSVDVWVELGKPVGILHVSVLQNAATGSSPTSSCRSVSGGGTACVAHDLNDGANLTTVDFTGRKVVAVTLTGSSSGGPLPLSDDELIVIAQAVAEIV